MKFTRLFSCFHLLVLKDTGCWGGGVRAHADMADRRQGQGSWKTSCNEQINKYIEENESQLSHTWKRYLQTCNGLRLEKTLKCYNEI